MYAAYDGKNIIAYHDDEEIVKAYCELIERYHNKKLMICHIKKKSEKKIHNLDDLYLVRYGETYVQAGYTEYLALMSDQLNYDHKLAKEVLMRILEISDLSEKESKHIKKSILILNKIISDEIGFVPELSYLRDMKINYEPYRYNYDIWKDDWKG